jgi:hypothetical protein
MSAPAETHPIASPRADYRVVPGASATSRRSASTLRSRPRPASPFVGKSGSSWSRMQGQAGYEQQLLLEYSAYPILNI